MTRQDISQYIEGLKTNVVHEVTHFYEESTLVLKQAVKQFEDLLFEKLNCYLNELKVII
ncbi:hypothetical protein [Bacillus sp. Marseille-P3661]|uniref:hypothetical protein n=1 Tax=Bacillus sp. Marseille-P3661 TaxID=1936234 RepID=UPI0015E18B4B|nr:hypothetical protein [Bacillus sp. Marseille-P3661]